MQLHSHTSDWEPQVVFLVIKTLLKSRLLTDDALDELSDTRAALAGVAARARSPSSAA